MGEGRQRDESPGHRKHALSSATEQAVAESQRALAALEYAVGSFTDEASRTRQSVAGEAAEATAREFDHVVGRLTEDVRDVFARRKASLGTFNIALFGRTGAGKSSLVEAMTCGDGESVSRGESDWTTDVRPVAWRSCQVYDTPGINGWGGRRDRAELEARARASVEIADIVLVCFDAQSQQVSEFAKLAEWVRVFRKPVVAVLNVRNKKWRLPPEASVRSGRASLSVAVRQHATNIADGLARTGFPAVPIVAISSRRALVARASTPYRGPDPVGFEKQREAYGSEKLATWSNYGRLEALLATVVAEHAVDLRLEGVRDQVAGVLFRAGHGLAGVAATAATAASTIETSVVGPILELCGYPAVSDRERRALLTDTAGRDLLALVEQRRRGAFQAATDGSFQRFVAQRLAVELQRLRAKSLAAAEERVLEAFDRGESLDGPELQRVAFDEAAIRLAADTVTRDALAFLSRSVQLAFRDLRVDLQYRFRELATIDGGAGGGWKWGGRALRTSGVVVGIAGTVGTVAAAMGWNPGGWVLAGVTLGLGVLAAALSWFGKAARAKAEVERLRARSGALADIRSCIHETYRQLEVALRSDAELMARQVLVDVLQPALRDTAALRAVEDLSGTLRSRANVLGQELAHYGDPHARIEDVARRLGQESSAHRGRAIWLGEDWIDDPHGLDRSVDSAEAERTPAYDPGVFERMFGGLRALFAGLGTQVELAAADEWLEFAGALLSGDPPAQSALDRLLEIRAAGQPRVQLVGDYNSGKSSFVKRLLIDAGEPIPDSLCVRAVPTTARTTEYQWNGLRLVDTPGMQSGTSAHDDAALHSVAEASAVVYLFQPSLVVGDTAGLSAVLNGDAERGLVPKANRAFFVINRADELGPDPEDSPEEYALLARRKCTELAQALRSRHIEVSDDRIFCMSSDPYGFVGDRRDVSSQVFDRYRHWDGFGAFAKAYRDATADLARTGAARSVLEGAVAAMAALDTRAAADEDCLIYEQHALSRVEGVLQEKAGEARRLSRSLQAALHGVVEAHAFRLRDEVLVEGDPARLQSLTKQLTEWWTDRALLGEVERWQERAAHESDVWRRHTEERLSRVLHAAEVQAAFSVHAKAPDFGGQRSSGSGWAAKATEAAGRVLGAANRDIVYGIGKWIGVRFRPWGAVRLAGRIARVGAVLAAVGVVFDIHDFWNQEKVIKQLEERRRLLNAFVEQSVVEVVRAVGGDESEPAGPLAALHTMIGGLDRHAEELIEAGASVRERLALVRDRRTRFRHLRADAQKRLGLDEFWGMP